MCQVSPFALILSGNRSGSVRNASSWYCINSKRHFFTLYAIPYGKRLDFSHFMLESSMIKLAKLH